MHHRVQGFYATVHHFWEVRDFGYIRYSKARIADGFGRAACGQQLYAFGVQNFDQFDQSRFVRNGEKGAPDWHEVR